MKTGLDTAAPVDFCPYKWSNVENGPVALVYLMKAIGFDVTFCGRSIRFRLHDLNLNVVNSDRKQSHVIDTQAI